MIFILGRSFANSLSLSCASGFNDAQDSQKELEKLFPTIEIIKRYKRKSLIRFGDLTVALGKYGVAIYFLPTGFTVNGLRLSIESFICSQSILEYIGAIPDGCEHGETIYNYSQCALPSSLEKAA